MELSFARGMHLLTLPDELFVMEIFPYLHSADLIRAFGTLANTRLLSLIYASIRHLDLPEKVNYIEALRHYQWNQIRSLRVHADHLHEVICSIFPSLDHLDVRMASSSISSCLLTLSTRVTHLRLSFNESERPLIGNHAARYIWHRDNRLQRLSIVNGVLMDESHFLELSSSLIRNEYLTHLSLVVVDLRSSIPLIALSPAVEHLRISLAKDGSSWLSHTKHFLERHQWSSRVKSLHFTAHDTYLDTARLCRFIKLFSASLERLTFYAHLIQSYLMRTRKCFEEFLLDHLTKLKRVDFCVHSLLGRDEYKNRQSFDSWKQQRHVISICNSWPGYRTRFTIPFVFDRLERVNNDFVDFHSNQARPPEFVLTLPSVTSISFCATAPLNLELMRTIKQACPRLRRIAFDGDFQFHNDLVEDTRPTLPTVERLCLCDRQADDDRTYRRLFSLIPNLDHLTVDSEDLQGVLNAVDSQHKRLDGIQQLTIITSTHGPIVDGEFIAQHFPNANVIYRRRSTMP